MNESRKLGRAYSASLNSYCGRTSIFGTIETNSHVPPPAKNLVLRANWSTFCSHII
jgi:hypothetical protein